MHKIIFVSNLYPNAREPNRGLYNFHLMQALQALGHDVEVIAPTPYFPPRAALLHRGLPHTHINHQPPPSPHPVQPCFTGAHYLYTPGIFIHHHWRMYRRAIAPILRARIQKLGVTGSRISYPANPTEPISSFCPNLSVSKDHQHTCPAVTSAVVPEAEAPQGVGTTSHVSPPTSHVPLPHIILGFIYPDAVAMDAICRELGAPYSVLVLGSDFRVRMQQPRFRPLVMRCLEQAPHIICPGQALKNDMVRAGIAEEKITYFNNGIDPDVFYADQTPRHNELLFVGNLVSVKAPERIIQAFGALKDLRSGGLRLVMIGEGPLRKRLEKLAFRLGIAPDEIEWTGALPQGQVAQRMRRARLLCLCSRSEGMPNVVAEALACGCPVVATSVGEIPYMLNETNGSIVPQHNDEPTTIQALTHALRTNQELRTKSYGPRTKDQALWSDAARRVEQGLGIRD